MMTRAVSRSAAHLQNPGHLPTHRHIHRPHDGTAVGSQEGPDLAGRDGAG